MSSIVLAGVTMTKVQFFMFMNPPTITQQEHKITMVKGKPRFYEPIELKMARQKIRNTLALHKLDEPLVGPLMLEVSWCFPIKGNHKDGEFKITKPDTDNLQKMLKDEMTKLKYWRDDAQVCAECIYKIWADIPGIFIRLSTIGERRN